MYAPLPHQLRDGFLTIGISELRDFKYRQITYSTVAGIYTYGVMKTGEDIVKPINCIIVFVVLGELQWKSDFVVFAPSRSTRNTSQLKKCKWVLHYEPCSQPGGIPTDCSPIFTLPYRPQQHVVAAPWKIARDDRCQVPCMDFETWMFRRYDFIFESSTNWNQCLYLNCRSLALAVISWNTQLFSKVHMSLRGFEHLLCLKQSSLEQVLKIGQLLLLGIQGERLVHSAVLESLRGCRRVDRSQTNNSPIAR